MAMKSSGSHGDENWHGHQLCVGLFWLIGGALILDAYYTHFFGWSWDRVLGLGLVLKGLHRIIWKGGCACGYSGC